MIKNIIAKFLLVYAIILTAIDLSIIMFKVVAPYFKVNFYFFNNRIVYIFAGFLIIYLIELLISAIFVSDRDYLTRNNMWKIIPQIIISLFYVLCFLFATFSLHIVFGLPFLLMAISLFFSHLLVTGYLGNTKRVIFWKIMSSLNSFLILDGMPVP